jgi:acetyl-CoA synthetase
VSVWHATPAAIAMLVGAGDRPTAEHDLSGLRHVVSTGGAIPPDAVAWTANVLRMPVHDSWLQAETGTALVANYRSLDIRPGSAGKAVPGVEVAVLDPEYNRAPADTEGLLAVRPGWPSMFRAYWNDPELYGSRFRRGWYATGDIARMDSDGYVWLADRSETGGRAKD